MNARRPLARTLAVSPLVALSLFVHLRAGAQPEPPPLPGEAGADGASCAKDNDCPGDDVCDGGRCRRPAPPPAPSPAPSRVEPPPLPGPPPLPPSGAPSPSASPPPVPVAAPPAAPRTRQRYLGFLIGAVGGAVAAGGLVAWGVVMNGQGEEAALARDRSRFDSAQTQQRVAYGLGAAFGALGLTSLILYFSTGREADTPSPRVRWAPGPGLVGLGAGGRF